MIRPNRYEHRATNGRRSRAVTGVTDINDKRPILIEITNKAEETIERGALLLSSCCATYLNPLRVLY
jgi:hypothetical protein